MILENSNIFMTVQNLKEEIEKSPVYRYEVPRLPEGDTSKIPLVSHMSEVPTYFKNLKFNYTKEELFNALEKTDLKVGIKGYHDFTCFRRLLFDIRYLLTFMYIEYRRTSQYQTNRGKQESISILNTGKPETNIVELKEEVDGILNYKGVLFDMTLRCMVNINSYLKRNTGLDDIKIDTNVCQNKSNQFINEVKPIVNKFLGVYGSLKEAPLKLDISPLNNPSLSEKQKESYIDIFIADSRSMDVYYSQLLSNVLSLLDFFEKPYIPVTKNKRTGVEDFKERLENNLYKSEDIFNVNYELFFGKDKNSLSTINIKDTSTVLDASLFVNMNMDIKDSGLKETYNSIKDYYTMAFNTAQSFERMNNYVQNLSTSYVRNMLAQGKETKPSKDMKDLLKEIFKMKRYCSVWIIKAVKEVNRLIEKDVNLKEYYPSIRDYWVIMQNNLDSMGESFENSKVENMKNINIPYIPYNMIAKETDKNKVLYLSKVYLMGAKHQNTSQELILQNLKNYFFHANLLIYTLDQRKK